VKKLSLIKIAKAYLRQAGARLEDAREALLEGNYPYAVRLSQECVEIEYPKIHDVSDILIDFVDRFPEWFRAELEFLRESSKILVKKRDKPIWWGRGFPIP
jgi:HEPN domain-containing protein